jgi:hypothetical protein
VSADFPEGPGPADPSLDGLVRVLTADGSADELAGRKAALAMFRRSHRRPRRRYAFPMSTAAALVLAGGIAAAYTAVLPAPVQHIAYRMLDRIGVPDAHRPPPSAGATPVTSIPSTTVNSAAVASPTTAPPGTAPPRTAPPTTERPTTGRPTTGRPTTGRPTTGRPTTACPCQTHTQGPAPQTLILTAAQAQILAGGDDVFSGRLTRGGRAEAGVRVRLLEHAPDGLAWHVAGSAITDRQGDVTLTVYLTSNASFRLSTPRGLASPAVRVTVIPPVYLQLGPGLSSGVDALTATAPFADTGDVVVLQELSAGSWIRIGQRRLDGDHLASFTVRVPKSGAREYRVVIPQTRSHGRSVSGRVRVAARAS